MGIVYLEGNWSPSEATFRVGPIMKIIILFAALVAITSAEPGWYGHRRPTYTHPAPPAHPTCACKTIYKTIQKTGEKKEEETKCENVPKQVCKDEHKKVCTPVSYGHHKRWKRHSYRKSYQPVHKPQPKCHYQTVQKCSTIHEQVCKKIYVTVPYTYEEKVPEKVCQKPKVVVKTKIEKVPAKEPKVECTKVPIKSCETKTKKECHSVPKQNCHYVTKKVCKREASPGGYGYSHGHYRKHQPRCFHKQEKVCSVEHKQVCTDRHYPVCSTSYKDQCRTTYVTVYKDKEVKVEEKVCTW